MPDYNRPSDEEIEALYRMARESSDFYEGLTTALRAQESQASLDKLPAAKSVKQE